MSVDARPEAIALSPGEIHAIGQRMPHRVVGPRPSSGSLRRFLTLTWMLAYLDFKLKFFGSVLGYAWQLVRPLMMFAVLYEVFTRVFRFGGAVPHYPVVLLSAIVIFTFFTDATIGAINSVVARENFIRKVNFPIIAAPLATVTSVFLTVVLNYFVVMCFALATGARPNIRWLEILPLLGMLYTVSAAGAVALSAYYVRFRDVQPIWEVIAQAMFYASPVIYTIEYVRLHSSLLAKVMMFNPVAAIIQQMRHAMIDPSAPSAVDAIGGWIYLSIPVGIVVLVGAFGYWSFSRMAPHFAEEL
jgi:ABC-2 type transport system permease protein